MEPAVLGRDCKGAADTFFEFSLLGLVTSGYLAVVGSGYLDLPVIVLTGAALLLRALIVTGVARLPLTGRVVAAATIAYIGFYPVDYFFLSGEFLPATVHLVFFVCVAKILTAKTSRDYFFVKIIAFLELLAASVLSSSLNFFVFLALFLVFGVATFASSEIRQSAGLGVAVARGGTRRFSWRLASLSLFVAAGILALTAGLFFVLPRTARAAFQHLATERYHLPGFSNEVVLGQIGEVKQQSTAVMRARIYSVEGEMPLKWRGAALSQFDGRRWYNPPGATTALDTQHGVLRLADDRQRGRSGVRINYEVYLKDIGADALFFAGIPEFVTIPAPKVLRTPTDSFRLGTGSTEGLRYGAYSFLESSQMDDGPAAPSLSAQVRQEYLLLPSVDPRIIQLTRRITEGLKSDEARVAAVQSYLSRNYAYSIELPAEEPSDPMAYFLFERRKGHCEYFASAMAVMLRIAWIPARVVTGFQSGIYNQVTGWHVIRASDAHSWVEAYLPRAGWRTFDPTPPDPTPRGATLLTRISLYLDAAETFWQEWVLDYNLDRQVILAYRMEQSSRRFQLPKFDHAYLWIQQARRRTVDWISARLWYLGAGLGSVFLAWFAGPPLGRWLLVRLRVMRLRRGRIQAGDATLLYQRMLKLMSARGLDKKPCMTPDEFVRLLPGSEVGQVVKDFTIAYNALRFGGKLDAARRMTQLLDRLERAG